MKLGLITLALFLGACTAGTIGQVTAEVPDASDDQSEANAPSQPPDAGMEEEAAPAYNSCVTAFQKPVTTGSQQAQNCLTQNWCTDSNGTTYQVNMWDSCHNFYCDWGLACTGTGNKTYCLPENDQSSPEYADENCLKPIAFVEMKNGFPASKYVGLDEYASNTDAGADAGWYSCRNVYTITTQWKDNGEMYYKALDYTSNTWQCYPTYVDFPNLKLYYLSANPVNPALLFVAQ